MRTPFLLLAGSLVLVACSERSPVAPNLLRVAADSGQPDTTHIPVLLHPAERTRIPQNVRATGCPANPSRGYGFQITFVWDSILSPQVAGYELFVKKNTAQFPLLDITVPSPVYTLTLCNAFVSDGNLEGWQWMVRAVDFDGRRGDWSAPINFGFKACRLQDGTPCFAG